MKRVFGPHILVFVVFFYSPTLVNAQKTVIPSSNWQQVNNNNKNPQNNISHILPAIASSSPKKGMVSTSLSNSLLTSGNWYKLGVTNDGIYKIDYALLKSMGINPSTVNPQYIHIYGKAGGMLPQANSAPRDNDLVENAIQVVASDTAFSQNDYVLFYAKGPTSWTYDSVSNFFHHQINYYADTAYYYFNVSVIPGKRITTVPSLTSSNPNIVTTYDAHDYHEVDKITDLTSYVKSGREWYGEQFNLLNNYGFNFNYPYFDNTKPVKFFSVVAAHAVGVDSGSSFTINLNGTDVNQAVAPIDGNWEDAYAAVAMNTYSINTTSGNISVVYNYNQYSEEEGWLDFFELNLRCSLTYASGQFAFRDASSLSSGKINQFQISGPTNTQVWDVTNFHNIVAQGLNSGGTSFNADASSLHEYVAFDGNNFYTPSSFGQIPNQNLHGAPSADMIIVSYPAFLDAANELAAFHKSHDGLSCLVVTTQQIYNEFSYAGQDVSAIRDFVRYLYNKAAAQGVNTPRYLLLFGDGSYDYKNHYANNSNYVPTYESYNSTEPDGSYASDAYYGFVDSAGGWTGSLDYDDYSQENDTLAVAVGRIPVDNDQQAHDFVNKEKRYCSPQAQGPWRNSITLIADSYEPDGSLHLQSTETLASIIAAQNPMLNIDKIYLDAYPLIQDNTGLSVPAAEAAIDQQVYSGTLVLNYIGHGDEVLLSHDDVLNISDINKWTNQYAMPLFMTATCQFGEFDDPEVVTGAETALLKADGGVIAVYTACRVVESGENLTLGEDIYSNNLFKKKNCQYPSIGEAFRIGQNLSGFDLNTRSFAMLGDPALHLAIPQYNIVTDTIISVSSNPSDTMKALCTMKLAGHIADCAGNTITNFDGKIFPLIYDKEQTFETLGQEVPVSPYQEYTNIIYSGQDSIKNGRFSLEFVVPKDIDYVYGHGKISYYAEDTLTDANGFDDSVIVGGTCPDAVVDTTPPLITLFMNDTNFVSGGLVNDQPLLMARVSDKLGLDVSDYDIGHQMTAMLNDSGPIILNDYFQSAPNDYKKGTINYKFINSLANGTYQLTVKVWNVADISAQATINFVVANSLTLAISNLSNYPNPFSKYTTFQFDDNQPGQNLQVFIDVYSIQGKVVYSMDDEINSPGTRSVAIQWNGDDGSGARLANGIYLYRLTVKTADGQQASLTQKLVIMHN